MNNKIYLVLALCLLTCSIKIQHEEVSNAHNYDEWKPIDVKRLTKDQSAVDLFIRGSEE
jgi:hypothetical protein